MDLADEPHDGDVPIVLTASAIEMSDFGLNFRWIGKYRGIQ